MMTLMEVVPIYCASCMNQDPQKRHVDMDAAVDRGYGDSGAVQVTMDDLQVCETCVATAARLIGYVDSSEQADRISNLERRLKSEQMARIKAERYADDLETALDNRPGPVHTPRKRGRPSKQEQEAFA